MSGSLFSANQQKKWKKLDRPAGSPLFLSTPLNDGIWMSWMIHRLSSPLWAKNLLIRSNPLSFGQWTRRTRVKTCEKCLAAVLLTGRKEMGKGSCFIALRMSLTSSKNPTFLHIQDYVFGCVVIWSQRFLALFSPIVFSNTLLCAGHCNSLCFTACLTRHSICLDKPQGFEFHRFITQLELEVYLWFCI